jgi:Uma2 family endonuclease
VGQAFRLSICTVESYNRSESMVAPLTHAQYVAFCDYFPESKVEYFGEGRITVLPLSDIETAKRNSDLLCQIGNWGEKEGSGVTVGSGTGFRFMNGSRLSPDAAWFDRARWRQARQSGELFPVFAPEFVMELRSPDDSLRLLNHKMREYMNNGVQLAWHIDPIKHTVTIYRPGQSPEVLTNPSTVAGEGPVEGFVLNLEGII